MKGKILRFPLTVLPITEAGDCGRAQEVTLSPGEFVRDALVIRTDVDLHYRNNQCQSWTIYAEPGQVQITVRNFRKWSYFDLFLYHPQTESNNVN